MHKKIAITALVTGLPLGVHGPELKQGETRLQFLIRHHPDEWKNFVDRIGGELGLSAIDCKKLLSQDAAMLNQPNIMAHVGKWANMRLPSHWRTLHSLSSLRSLLAEDKISTVGLCLAQILWPRERHPSGDDSAERMASANGAEVVSLPLVKGEYLWIVPGGSSFMGSTTSLSLERIIMWMEANPMVALYSDGAYSMIYQMSAIHSVANHSEGLPLTHSLLCTLLERMNFSCMGDRDPENPLCEIEKIYGGTYPFPKPAGASSWFRKLFGF